MVANAADHPVGFHQWSICYSGVPCVTTIVAFISAILSVVLVGLCIRVSRKKKEIQTSEPIWERSGGKVHENPLRCDQVAARGPAVISGPTYVHSSTQIVLLNSNMNPSPEQGIIERLNQRRASESSRLSLDSEGGGFGESSTDDAYIRQASDSKVTYGAAQKFGSRPAALAETYCSADNADSLLRDGRIPMSFPEPPLTPVFKRNEDESKAMKTKHTLVSAAGSDSLSLDGNEAAGPGSEIKNSESALKSAQGIDGQLQSFPSEIVLPIYAADKDVNASIQVDKTISPPTSPSRPASATFGARAFESAPPDRVHHQLQSVNSRSTSDQQHESPRYAHARAAGLSNPNSYANVDPDDDDDGMPYETLEEQSRIDGREKLYVLRSDMMDNLAPGPKIESTGTDFRISPLWMHRNLKRVDAETLLYLQWQSSGVDPTCLRYLVRHQAEQSDSSYVLSYLEGGKNYGHVKMERKAGESGFMINGNFGWGATLEEVVPKVIKRLMALSGCRTALSVDCIARRSIEEFEEVMSSPV